jgi:hypothetical protein
MDGIERTRRFPDQPREVDSTTEVVVESHLEKLTNIIDEVYSDQSRAINITPNRRQLLCVK